METNLHDHTESANCEKDDDVILENEADCNLAKTSGNIVEHRLMRVDTESEDENNEELEEIH